ncbi:MAG TPA: FKBP-type peptidyl-prolyl cis-trans isomerase [Cyclobacteriaceae bacterium]|nr:FKBP-type peptidyl-prolyl cis-trans isomerase [Cyclobacteriaceae bacterium]
MKRIALFALIGLLAGLANCSTDAVVCSKNVDQTRIDAVPKNQLNTDIARISNYLSANNLTAIADPSGLRYAINKTATGNTPCLSSTVVVSYSGRVLLSNGNLAATTFDAQTNAQFGLSGLILAWQIAFPKFAPGTNATLYVPSGLAYGTASPSAAIPPNSVLVFEVTLVSFQ